ncbi:hypothetical protein K432DRAFT_88127 [Lepidopterella palustris CBS 459.81]|uniref:Uncharacterized protein n=1 Tax=Lepidopterella palustris CBS 459.81 TaxID=1314670 RepID=A0A8E2E7F2_9PEZI|nr:hypothetical protein K432DRAFT_88127 [Lepidopterella palustris CBS 459.81]
MQLSARYPRRNPSFMNHTPRVFEMAPERFLEPLSRSHSEARARISRSPPDPNPFNYFDKPSPYNSVPSVDYTSPYNYHVESENHDRSLSPPASYVRGHSTSLQPTRGLGLSLTNLGDAASSTSASIPLPYSWASSDSDDFESAVAGEYSPYEPDVHTRVGQEIGIESRRQSSGHTSSSQTMKAPPILPPEQQHHLPVNNPSFDISYFLKNTGPPGQRGATSVSASDGMARGWKTKHKSPLRFLRVRGRKSLAARVGTVEGEPNTDTLPTRVPDADKDTSTTFFIPPDGVVQKVSKDGKKYLQIVADEKSVPTQKVEIPRRYFTTAL